MKRWLEWLRIIPKAKEINYRFNIHCPECGEFLSKNHHCRIRFKRKSGDRYKCNRCHKYLPYEQFQKDRTKKYGINTKCKRCRQEIGNGNKTVRQIETEWY